MSVLTEKTERQAIAELAKCLIHFERLYPFNMSEPDAFQARQAQNLIQAVIETNGYRAVHVKGKGTRIYKVKTDKMKPLEQLNNVERAKLLHELFKDMIPAFLRFTANMVVILREGQEEHRSAWEGQLITFDFWLCLANDVARKIERYGTRLEKESRLFSDQLFDGYHALFMAHCLNQYARVHTPKNVKFTLAIELLFSYQPKPDKHEILQRL